MERASVRHEDDGQTPAFADGDEARLVESARALGEEAWAEIYRRHAQQVYGYVYFRLGDQHTAEDLTADVFVKAIAGIKSYAYRGTPLLAWLYRIAHNVTVDYRKAAARHMQHLSDAPPEDIEEREDALAMLDDRSDMLSAIRALTEEQQQVILLRFYQGLTNAEVSAVMGKPEGAVKALQSRGLRSLRRMIGANVQEATA
jgi:RNA polymerase sigma-70 factor (ECF subfamily)